MDLTPEDLHDWNSNPVTKAVVEELNRSLQEMRERSTLRPTADATAMETAKTEGIIEGISAFLDAYQFILDEVEK